MFGHFGGYVREVFRLGRSRTARNAGLVMVGNLGSAVLRFSVSLILARVLLAEQWGYLVIFITLMDMVSIFCDSGINATMVRFIAAEKESTPLPAIKRCAQIKLVVCSVVLVALACIYLPFMRIQDMPSEYAWLFPLGAVAGIFLSLHTYALSIIQGTQNYLYYSVLATSVNIIRLALIAVLVLAGFTAQNTLFVAFFVPLPLALMLTAWGALHLIGRIERRPAKQVVTRELLTFMLPLGILNVITVLISRVDIFMLQTMTTPATVGAYGLAFQIAFIFPLVTSAIFIALLPKVSGMTTVAELSRYRRRVLLLYPAIVVATILAVVASPFFLRLIFGDKYAAAIPILQMLLLAFGLHIIFNPLGLIFYSLNRPHVLTIIHAIQLPTLILINLLLIPPFGAIGATIAALAVRLFGVAAVVWLTSRALRERAAVESRLA